MLRRYLKKRKSKSKGSGSNLCDDAFVKLPDDSTRGICRTSIGEEEKTIETSPLPKDTLVWFITSNVENDWYIPAIVESYVLQGNEVVKYILKMDESESNAFAFDSKSNVVKKAKKGLAHAPPINVIHRWNNQIVPCPIIGIANNNDLIDKEGDNIISLDKAWQRYGCNLGFRGANQARTYGPEMWGITLDQLKAIIQDDAFTPAQSIFGVRNGKGGMTMYDVVEKIIKPKTRGKGLGYSLYTNRKNPLRANVMVSHAWEDDYERFVDALVKSGSQGPFWVCAMAMYQNEDIPKLTIAKQLGPHPSTGPFATVLKQSSKMIVIITPDSDIYTRLWCVYEIFTAVQLGVPIDVSFFSETIGEGNQTYYDAGIDKASAILDTKKARCSNPGDMSMIASQISGLEGGFDLLNDVIYWVKMIGLIQAARAGHHGTCETISNVPFGESNASCTQSRLNAAIAMTLENWRTSKKTYLAWEMLLRNHADNDAGSIGKENQNDNIIEINTTIDTMEHTTAGKDVPMTMLIAQVSIMSQYVDSKDDGSVDECQGCVKGGCTEQFMQDPGLLEYINCNDFFDIKS